MLKRYMHWLHTRWPAGTVEKLPECGEHGGPICPASASSAISRAFRC